MDYTYLAGYMEVEKAFYLYISRLYQKRGRKLHAIFLDVYHLWMQPLSAPWHSIVKVEEAQGYGVPKHTQQGKYLGIS